jgi:hypothetical protein
MEEAKEVKIKEAPPQESFEFGLDTGFDAYATYNGQ